MASQGAPRPALGLVRDTFDLYRRFPLLFLVLAAGVIVPYEAIVLALTGTGPFAQSASDPRVDLLLTVADFALIAPLVSALHVHAVAEARAGGEPRLGSIARQGLRVLPVVMAVSIVSWVGITLGFLALFVPGMYLTLRWAVVAQAAAIENEGWLPALRRSGELAKENYGHVFALVLCSGLIVGVPALLIGLAFSHDSTDVGSFLVGVAVQIAVYSFGALVTALLYYDLRARHELAVWRRGPAMDSSGTAGSPSAASGPPVAHSWDVDDHSPRERPSGWYVDPDNPARMRYWDGGDPPAWTDSTTRTPRKIKDAWAKRHRGE